MGSGQFAHQRTIVQAKRLLKPRIATASPAAHSLAHASAERLWPRQRPLLRHWEDNHPIPPRQAASTPLGARLPSAVIRTSWPVPELTPGPPREKFDGPLFGEIPNDASEDRPMRCSFATDEHQIHPQDSTSVLTLPAGLH